MQVAPQHLDQDQLEKGLDTVKASPRDAGRLETIVLRPAPGERRVVDVAEVSAERGLAGDRWASESQAEFGSDHPHHLSQISLMNARILRLIAGGDEAMCLAGDNLVVDLDLSEQNLPAGSRLAVGDVVLELTGQPHTGCGQFARRYGTTARQFINGPLGVPLNLRGRYARVIQGGKIRLGDEVRKA